MNATAWSRGLEVAGGGTGVVSHAGLVLLRQLADRTGLTAGLSAALPSPDGGLDRGRVFADLASAIADGARVISDFRVMGDQGEVFGQVASAPTAWRALKEAAAGGDRTRRKVTAAVNKARRHAWAQAMVRHGQLPPVQVADRQLTGITCIRLDATVVHAHSGKELAEANFKGYGHHPLLASCDNTRGDRGASAAVPAEADGHLRRRRSQPRPGEEAGQARVPPRQLTYSVGWALGERERAALPLVPGTAWEAAIDAGGKVRERRSGEACANHRCGHRACRQGNVSGITQAFGTAFVSATQGWVAGMNVRTGEYSIEATTNGGHTWTRQYQIR